MVQGEVQGSELGNFSFTGSFTLKIIVGFIDLAILIKIMV